MKNKITIYANALLSDGAILFWRTAQSEYDEYSFYKDFMYSQINQDEYSKNHKMECVSMKFEYNEELDDTYDKLNNYVFHILAKHFYKLFPISEDSKGNKPY